MRSSIKKDIFVYYLKDDSFHTYGGFLYMSYIVVYDGNCNLCVTLVQVLEGIDKGQLFKYIPMQDDQVLNQFSITAKDCEMGMILIDTNEPKYRWQGSDAAEKIGQLLPGGDIFVAAYQSLPGAKWIGDRFYEQIRDNRYTIFGKRSNTYNSVYPVGCKTYLFQEQDSI